MDNSSNIVAALFDLSYCFDASGQFFPTNDNIIMTCPVISLSIAVYAGYRRKNKVLLALLTIWGLTGIKSIIFNVYEDIILLIGGLYGATLLIREIRQFKAA